jgi:hypothetical protein
MTNCRSIIGTVLVLCCVCPPRLAAQSPVTCSYDACALRLHHTFFKTEIVQGHDARPVASLSLFGAVSRYLPTAPTPRQPITPASAAVPPAATLLGLAGLVVTTLGLVEYDSDHDAGVALVIGGGTARHRWWHSGRSRSRTVIESGLVV